MTTMSMNVDYTANHSGLSLLSTPLTNALDRFDRASTIAADWCVEHVLDAAGGLALAMVPFSLLTWMFVAF